jgi:hypothetical protein
VWGRSVSTPQQDPSEPRMVLVLPCQEKEKKGKGETKKKKMNEKRIEK